MKNFIFNFKQFSVRNSLAAMKVGTDGVLLGAWCDVRNARKVLDVGTGTGLISLMVAQRNNEAVIDAIEIDYAASEEAAHNVANSPWADRILVINADFSEYTPRCKYDLIVSNPPYFSNGILPPDNSRMIARHCKTLTYDLLISKAASILVPGGGICIITPFEADNDITSLVSLNNLHICRKTFVRPKPNAKFKRILWQIGDEPCETIVDELQIEKENHHEYTSQYIDLTKDFYLKM